MKKLIPPLTIFIGSFLLFVIQPMLGRMLLPRFGGTAAVWTVCLAAFQVLLLAGYFYAHRMANVSVSKQRQWHIALLGTAILWTLCIFFFRFFSSSTSTSIIPTSFYTTFPALGVLFFVVVLVGFPYVLLSANSSLIQSWLSHSQSNVYRLYAVSNLGSFCGLFFYPFILEPFVSLTSQWIYFTTALLFYTLFVAFIRPAHLVSQTFTSQQSTDVAPVNRLASFLFFFIPLTSVFFLNSMTTHLTLDVMPLPLLWSCLLGVFLLSYVVAFRDRSVRHIFIWQMLTFIFAIAIALVKASGNGRFNFVMNLFVGIGFCFVACTFLHTWLYAIRPNGKKLTRFYLFNALGGSIGGVLASIVAPLIFVRITEYPIATLLVATLGVLFVFYKSDFTLKRPKFYRGVFAFLFSAFCVAFIIRSLPQETRNESVIYRDRGFFGTIKVVEMPIQIGTEHGTLRQFVHGTTIHGTQINVPGQTRTPTVYFVRNAGGVAVLQHPKYKQNKPMKVGVLGLGMGTYLAYSRTNDVYVCYEISPEVIKLATNANYFTFVSEAPCEVVIKAGDARKNLEAEREVNDSKFDLLVVDAFTGDNLPYHLATREAFQLYFDRLQPNGILAVHISNWHIDLTPLIKAVGTEFNCPVGVFRQTEIPAVWAIFMPNPSPDFTLPNDVLRLDFDSIRDIRLPTDEKGSFIGLIQWWK